MSAVTMALLMEAAARLTRRKPVLTRVMVRGFAATRAFDTSKARRELGFQPKVGLEDGIRATIREYAAKGYL